MILFFTQVALIGWQVSKQSTKKKNSFVYNYRESFPLAGMTIVLFDLPRESNTTFYLIRSDLMPVGRDANFNNNRLKKFSISNLQCIVMLIDNDFNN